MLRAAIVLLGLLMIDRAEACRSAPPELSVPHQALLDRSKNIVLVRAIKAEYESDFSVWYTFQSIKVIAGSSDKTFRFEGAPLLFSQQIEMFDDHMDPRFWSPGIGRVTQQSDCKIHPAFAVGAMYLLFLDEPRHVKGFEQLFWTGEHGKKDKWLEYVEEHARR